MKKKKKKDNAIIVIGTTIVLLILIIGPLYLISNNTTKNKEYKIEPRTENFQTYKEKTPQYDVDSWLRVQGTNIDYPIIYDNGKNNLNEIVDDFLWKLEKTDEIIDRTVILGHNIRNVSSTPLITESTHTRFEQLMSFIYYDFAKENQYIQYTMNGKDYLYQIFSVSLIKENQLIKTGYLTKEELKEYIEDAKNDSYFKYDIEVDENDKIITLVTCTRFFGGTKSYRFKIEGKMIDEEEKAINAEVTIKDNYKEIENILKGGILNEEA